MTNSEITTQPNTSTTAPAFALRVAPINHTAVAQLLGDEEYDTTLALAHDGVLAADAYHLAVQRYARAHAGLAAPICDCDLCCAEFGACQD